LFFAPGFPLYSGLASDTNGSIEVKSILIAAAIVALGLTSALANDDLAKDIVVYKNPECGCCTKWVSYLESHDYNVTIESTRDVYEVKKRLGVPEKLAACHTAVIDGYVIEGHITHRDIKRLLLFRPDVTGIAVPGMPIGTPGMERGNTVQPHNVMTFDDKGNVEVFVKH
jgi:hypothetical protein